jgi:hypothetical protein
MDATWIPQLFFDLVGRVLPGAILILTGFAVVFGPSRALSLMSNKDPLTFGSSVLWSVLAYFLGLMASQLWGATIGKLAKRRESKIDQKCLEKCLAEHNRIQEALGGPQIHISPDKLPRVFVMHDHLRLVDKDEALRLLKLLAEQRLCHSVSFGFLAMVILNIWLYVSDPSRERLVLEGGIVLVIIVFWGRALRLREFFATGTCVAWFSFATSRVLLSLVTADDATEMGAGTAGKRPTLARSKRTPDGTARSS